MNRRFNLGLPRTSILANTHETVPEVKKFLDSDSRLLDLVKSVLLLMLLREVADFFEDSFDLLLLRRLLLLLGWGMGWVGRYAQVLVDEPRCGFCVDPSLLFHLLLLLLLGSCLRLRYDVRIDHQSHQNSLDIRDMRNRLDAFERCCPLSSLLVRLFNGNSLALEVSQRADAICALARVRKRIHRVL